MLAGLNFINKLSVQFCNILIIMRLDIVKKVANCPSIFHRGHYKKEMEFLSFEWENVIYKSCTK